MSKHNTVEEYQHGRCKIRIEIDDDPQNPRKEFDHVGTMVNWHDRYDLGDVNGRREYGDSEEFLRSLAGDYRHEELQDVSMDAIWRIVQENFVLLPLGLYDHSGISMFVGRSGDLACDSAGWDTSSIGYIYCSLKKAQEEWGTEDSKAKGWGGEASYTLAPDGTKRTLREATTLYLEGEVEEYDQYLTGQVYGYIVEAEDGEEDSCWGFFGDLKYVKEEAESSADWQNERMAKADEEAALVEREKELAEVWP